MDVVEGALRDSGKLTLWPGNACLCDFIQSISSLFIKYTSKGWRRAGARQAASESQWHRASVSFYQVEIIIITLNKEG